MTEATRRIGGSTPRPGSRLDRAMPDSRTVSLLEARNYHHIAAECCKGTVWVPFQMLRRKIPTLSAMTIDELGAKLRCDRCGRRPAHYYPARQEDAPGYSRKGF